MYGMYDKAMGSPTPVMQLADLDLLSLFSHACFTLSLTPPLLSL